MMVEEKYLRKIMSEYEELLERYESIISEMSVDDIKRLLGEVRLFWYRYKKFTNYFLSKIEKVDEVYYLAGALRIDIKNNGHLEFLISGKVRVINDPILKMSVFYSGADTDINFEYINEYLIDCIYDLLVLLREYKDDFYVLPVEPIQAAESNNYHGLLEELSEKFVLSMFKSEYSSIKCMIEMFDSYESIEQQLLPWISDYLVFDSLKDRKLSLREKCSKYLASNQDKLPLLGNLNEPQVFFMAINQYLMQVLAIINYTLSCNLWPFIRDDITFNYFTLIFQSTGMKDFSHEDYLNVYIPYVVQKNIDFSEIGYLKVRSCLGDCKLVKYIRSHINDQEAALPSPSMIVNLAQEYIENNC
ncbi:MAG: hypothetical protein J5476_03120 [Lachnospiraceae bacterium]|nr:hypothetical protein [Lachnospiraceae bacterium]